MRSININSKAQIPLSRWQIFSAAPHRLWFFFGAINLLLSMGWWLAHLLGRDYAHLTLLHTVIAPAWAHAYLMLYGAFSFFIFGFLMTVYPRWMQTSVIPRKEYLPSSVLLFTGYLLCFIGFIGSLTLAIVGSLIMLLGWGIALFSFVSVLRRTDNIISHAIATTFGLIAAWIGLLLMLLWLLADDVVISAQLANIGIQIGIWCYLLPVYFSVSHRMIPFFSQVVVPGYKLYRPDWCVPLFIFACVLHFVLNIFSLPQWFLIADIPLLLISLLLSVRWQPQHCMRTSILASLHIGFAWLWIAMALLVAQDIAFAVSDKLIMSLAPLHALTIGFFTTMLVAMVTRVTMGHSGNPLTMDGITWLIFLSVQLIAVVRIAASFPFLNALFTVSLNSIAAILWLLCLVPWVIKYAPIYLKPRADNQPG